MTPASPAVASVTVFSFSAFMLMVAASCFLLFAASSAFFSFKTSFTDAPVVVDLVHTNAVERARVTLTLVHLFFTRHSSEPVLAGAGVFVLSVHTCAAVEARFHSALVHITLTVETLVAGPALAAVPAVSVGALSAGVAHVLLFALVYVHFTIVGREAVLAVAGVRAPGYGGALSVLSTRVPVTRVELDLAEVAVKT